MFRMCLSRRKPILKSLSRWKAASKRGNIVIFMNTSNESKKLEISTKIPAPKKKKKKTENDQEGQDGNLADDSGR